MIYETLIAEILFASIASIGGYFSTLRTIGCELLFALPFFAP